MLDYAAIMLHWSWRAGLVALVGVIGDVDILLPVAVVSKEETTGEAVALLVAVVWF
jgi:hypothetical protein